MYRLILCFFFISCATKQVSMENKKQQVKEPFSITKAHKIVLQPGKVNFISFQVALSDGQYQMTCNKQQIPFVVSNGEAMLYMVENYFSQLKPYGCEFHYEGKKHQLINVSVIDFPYKEEKLNVAKRRIDLNKKDLARVIKEKEIKKNIYKKSAPYFLFDKPFKVPLDSYITSHYGVRRLFNNKKRGQHLGNDFRAKTGTPIPVSNRGQVVFTGDLFFSGKSVVVDHGLGIFTAYMHLSSIKVSKGDLLSQGDVVGLSGMTGRVSGPHLHWGVKVAGHWVDGFSLVKESQEQFDE